MSDERLALVRSIRTLHFRQHSVAWLKVEPTRSAAKAPELSSLASLSGEALAGAHRPIVARFLLEELCTIIPEEAPYDSLNHGPWTQLSRLAMERALDAMIAASHARFERDRVEEAEAAYGPTERDWEAYYAGENKTFRDYGAFRRWFATDLWPDEDRVTWWGYTASSESAVIAIDDVLIGIAFLW